MSNGVGGVLSAAGRRVAGSLDRRRAPLALGVLAAVGMAVRLLLPTPVAMADNNDGKRLLCMVHADTGAPKWVFAVMRYAREAPGAHCGGYPSLQQYPLRLVSWLHQDVFHLAGVVDMRELILGYCLLVGVVVAVFARLLAGLPAGVRLALVVALFLVLGDATFADYAGSPYTETSALYGLMIFSVAGVALVGRRGRPAAVFAAAWVGALLTVGAKTETFTLAVPFAAFFATRRLAVRRLPAGRPGGRFGTRFRTRAVPVLAALAVVLAGLWEAGTFGQDGENNQYVNIDNELTMTVMPLSGDPAGVATGMGLPASFAEYSGTNAWSPHPIQGDPLFPAVQGRITKGNLIRFMLARPALAEKVFRSGAAHFYQFRNTDIGDYPRWAGHPASAQEHRLTVVASVAHAMRWSGTAGMVLFWAGCLVAAGWLWRRTPGESVARGFAVVAVLATCGAVIQYLTAVYGEGNEVTKHLSVALFAGCLGALWVVCSAVALRWGPRGAGPGFGSVGGSVGETLGGSVDRSAGATVPGARGGSVPVGEMAGVAGDVVFDSEESVAVV